MHKWNRTLSLSGLLFLLVFSVLHVSAQSSKGAVVTNTSANQNEGKTYALIVGISKYKNPAIPSLQFADKDALAFRNYLVATGVDSNNITLLLNEQATYAETMLSLDEICSEKAKAGDKVFIYFSGHGDVESRVITNVGYLLTYDAPRVVYAISAINVRLLQDYVSTLSAKGVQAFVITDACHSGNLAGGLEGLKNIQAVLGDKWKDEVKMLSCQPGELSLEGKQWGNGRGLFSYELINGMAWLADKNNDGKVTLRELNLYLMEKVPDGAHPIPQNPVINGDMNAIVSTVNQKLLAQVTSNQTTNTLAAIDVKGFDEALLKGLDDTAKENYRLFKLCLDSNVLVSRSPPNAYYYYQQFTIANNSSPLIGLMKQNFSSALITSIEKDISFLVNNQMTKMVGGYHLRKEAQVLKRLLDDNTLKRIGVYSKVLMAEAFVLNDGDIVHMNEAIRITDTALMNDPSAAYIYWFRGNNLGSLKKVAQSVNDFHRAMELSPNFALPFLSLTDYYTEAKKFDTALFLCHKVYSSMPFEASGNLALIHFKLNNKDSLNYYLSKISFMVDSTNETREYFHKCNLAMQFFYFVQDFNSSIKYAKLLDNGSAFYHITKCFSKLNDIQSAINYFEKTLQSKWFDYTTVNDEPDFSSIRSTPEFKALMKKHFPDEYKE